jgi:hypothetical protein
MMKAAVADARALVGDASSDAATVIRGPWGVGIVGLVAARLVEDRGRPAVVGADLGEVVRASCRSDGSLDLGATLERCGDLFIGPVVTPARRAGWADRWDEFEAFPRLAAEKAPAVAVIRSTWPPAGEVDCPVSRTVWPGAVRTWNRGRWSPSWADRDAGPRRHRRHTN